VRNPLLPGLIAVLVAGCGTAIGAAGPTAPPSYRATVLSDHPVAYWPIDETSGTVMTDATRNGNNGDYTGGFALGQPGAVAGVANGSVAFDGLTGAAAVPDSASLRVDHVTIEVWLKKRADTEYGAYVTKNLVPGDIAGTGWFELLNGYHDGRIEFRVTGDAGATFASSGALELNRWYYVAATYDGTTAKLYINGVLDNSITINTTPKQSADPLFLGRRPDGYFNNAFLDEVAIYPGALSADRILAHWRVGSVAH
jgi:Concanavalin A-like lectin/glucanases superfamily